MFNLFKRSKIKKWEIDLLLNIFSKIKDNKFHRFQNQIKEGLLRNILLDASDIDGYNSFGFNHDVFKRYETKEPSYQYSDIGVYDLFTKSYLKYSIYISSGVVCGYSIENLKKKFKLDINKIDISQVKKVYLKNPDYDIIKHLFSEEEILLINTSEIFKIRLNNRDYFHLKDLEDGDFIGIDSDKNFYKITHDPIEIIPLNKKMVDALKEYQR